MIVQMYWLATSGQTLGKRWMKSGSFGSTAPTPASSAPCRGAIPQHGRLPDAALVFGRALGYAYMLADVLFIFGAKKAASTT